MADRFDVDAVRAGHPTGIVAEEAEQAAVLVPVIDRPDGHAVLFTERADHLPNHAGEMSFPGGGREERDADLEATALRESHEEVGLRPGEVDVVGQLDDVPGPYGHVVRPFVGTVPDRAYEPTSAEVAACVVLPLAALSDPANFDTERRSGPDGEGVTLPFFRVDGHVVWGLTGHVLRTLLELSTDWRPE